MMTCKVRFLPFDREVEVPAGTCIGEAAQQAGIEILMPCGGQGRCGRCAVIVQEGEVRHRSTQRISPEDVAAGYVLACQTAVEEDLVVLVPPQEKIERRLKEGKRAEKVELPFPYDLHDQSLRKYAITLELPSLQDQTDDWSRLRRELSRRYPDLDGAQVSLPVLRRLGRALREGEWTVTVVVELDPLGFGEPKGPPLLIDVLPGEHLESLWAAAIDIGTTSNVVWLVDLISGEVMARKVDYNGQIARGEDVISRIIYASKGNGLEELQHLVMGTLNRLLQQAAQERSISTDEIYKAVVAGNSTMIHLFAGLPPESIRLMPFITGVNQVPLFPAREIGLGINPGAMVDCLPCIGSYVGADITAGVVSSNMCGTGELTLFVDIGTNGEIVLGDCTWLIACACSAGPAFEGAGVVHGMRATAGAIEEVWIKGQVSSSKSQIPSGESGAYEATYRVIGDEKPRGICGSGLISLMAEMFAAGVVDKSGNVNLNLPTKRVRKGKHGAEYVVAWAEETATGEDIVVTAVDVNNLMRAKAAIYAGFSILARSVGLSISDVGQVLIGGAFGQYINVERAIQIGLLPDKPFDDFHFLGNTSVRGAYMALLSRGLRQRMSEVGQMMTYLELSADNTFFDEFNAAMFLPHTDESQFPSVAAMLTGDRERAFGRD
ncbi:MAG: ASKHA domain-containing protein [Chloroflexota bacterium]|nr:ASKHA domain-containing protein [Chloroflexota bacterium]